LLELIAAARRADALAYGKPCIARVVARLDAVALTEIIASDAYGGAWRAAATSRLRALGGVAR
jgi:hypothetical protein